MPGRKELMRHLITISMSISVLIITIPHRLLNHLRGGEHIPRIPLDDLIPFVGWFVYPYLFWFFFVAMILIVMAVRYRRDYYQLLVSMVVSTVICLLIFYYFPTTVPRIEISGNDLTSQVLRFTYGSDQPYDCLPSLHVLFAFLATVFYVRCSRSVAGKWFAVISCVLICLSTLFIKQHYIMDAVAAVAIALPFYLGFTLNETWRRWPEPASRLMKNGAEESM